MENPIVKKYKVVDWTGNAIVINIDNRECAESIADRHQGTVVEYEDYKYIRVRVVRDKAQ